MTLLIISNLKLIQRVISALNTHSVNLIQHHYDFQH